MSEGASPQKLLVKLDGVNYRAKPDRKEFGAITNRLKKAKPSLIDAAAFCEHVKLGRTWVGGVFEGERFVGQQLFALDFDNCAEGTDGDGHKVKRQLSLGEPGYLDPMEALDRCERLGKWPLCLYFTFSAKAEPWQPRYRIVFATDRAISDPQIAEGYLKRLLRDFPEADQACKNPNRLFCGSQGEVWPCWLLEHWPEVCGGTVEDD